MERPKVGLGGIIIKEGKILLAKRKGKFGGGTWGTFGGHLEFEESFNECIKREAREELGIDVKIVDFICVSNLIDNEHHYVDLVFLVEIVDGEPVIMEPEKHEKLGWYDLDNIPNPLFISIKKALESLRNNNKINDSR